MNLFPNAKINLGLNITEKRSDGYHNIETVFYPISLCDQLEIDRNDRNVLQVSGIKIEGDPENNLVMKAYNLLAQKYQLSPVKVILNKQIPIGAGLGGGSSDGAWMLKGLNQLFNLKMSEQQLIEYASRLGSDCAFFIVNQPGLATGRGELLAPVTVSLKGYHLVLVKPNDSVSTIEAYSGVKPQKPAFILKDIIQNKPEHWKKLLSNQFESTIFPGHPTIRDIKEELYHLGAVYAAMSGSGSSVFGIFKTLPEQLPTSFPDYFIHSELCTI